MTAARWAAALVGVGAIGVAGWAFVDTPAAVSGADTTVPTERVARGALSLDVHLDGELRAAKSVSIAAPSVGGTLRILSMLETGTEVSEGDVGVSAKLRCAV
jgi:multidrug efflux pump subunit AcrA (membrane-fusion protein)